MRPASFAATISAAHQLDSKKPSLSAATTRDERLTAPYRHRIDVVCVRLDGAHELVAAPHLDGLVVRAGEDVAVVRRRHAKHLLRVSG